MGRVGIYVKYLRKTLRAPKLLEPGVRWGLVKLPLEGVDVVGRVDERRLLPPVVSSASYSIIVGMICGIRLVAT
jgi:hypothetical protein